MPNHPRAGTSTAVARCVANSFTETGQCPRELWTSVKNIFETFWTSRSKVLTDSFCCCSYIPPCIYIIIRVFCPRAGPSLQAQEPRLQFCRRQVFHRKLRNQGCSFTRDRIGAVYYLSPFSICTDLKRSEKIPGAPTWRWGEWIWLTGSSGLNRNSPQGLNISSISVFDQIRDPEIPNTRRPFIYIYN